MAEARFGAAVVSIGGRLKPTSPEATMPMPTPATTPPVIIAVSKKRAVPVTGAPVTPFWMAWTRVSPASIATMEVAMTMLGRSVSPTWLPRW